MPMYPRPLEQQFAAALTALRQRVTKLETRTVAIDSGFPLAALPAMIDPGYTTGNPSVYVNGSTSLSGPYQYLASYTPAAGDSVVVLPVGGTSRTYIILGKLA